eukprot:CAMPEP_0177556584 /NCGR_PEP_ID=MMETSP0369-20130122/69156_1 /TAXON_ID=447022 ORGANISM="Scrippsiella hangoei-like, Strain SHHI-4" /NCGR_SAMPLE_ID=MMETSP0369 /ASSEMBLY_ACC=CAM_ASM_000364 /LENGTH=211 /DNA_ID=CAMNT_0019042807 /DNA_START=108 /DNA_END=740 /DNA_ORIENTATION=-
MMDVRRNCRHDVALFSAFVAVAEVPEAFIIGPQVAGDVVVGRLPDRVPIPHFWFAIHLSKVALQILVVLWRFQLEKRWIPVRKVVRKALPDWLVVWVDDLVAVVVRRHKEMAVHGLSSITTIGIGNSHCEVGVGLRKTDIASGVANERCDLPHLHRQAPHLVRAQITMEVLVLRIQGRHRRPRKGPSNILSDLPPPVDGSKSEGRCSVFSH